MSLKKITSLLGLNNILNPSEIVSGIKKASPFLSKFINKGVAQGYGTGAIISFLSDLNKKGRLDPNEAPAISAEKKRAEQERAPEKALTSAATMASAYGIGSLMGGDEEEQVSESVQIPQGKEQVTLDANVQPQQQQPQQQEQAQQQAMQQQAMQQQPMQPPPQQQEQPQEAFGRQESLALDAINTFQDLAQIDPVVAMKIREGLSKGLSSHDIEAALKRSKVLGTKTMMLERKLGKPISWVIDYIQNKPEGMQSQGRSSTSQEHDLSFLSALKEASRIADKG